MKYTSTFDIIYLLLHLTSLVSELYKTGYLNFRDSRPHK